VQAAPEGDGLSRTKKLRLRFTARPAGSGPGAPGSVPPGSPAPGPRCRASARRSARPKAVCPSAAAPPGELRAAACACTSIAATYKSSLASASNSALQRRSRPVRLCGEQTNGSEWLGVVATARCGRQRRTHLSRVSGAGPSSCADPSERTQFGGCGPRWRPRASAISWDAPRDAQASRVRGAGRDRARSGARGRSHGTCCDGVGRGNGPT
jgi:hypothetical protein